jgi:CelD/BcsL family acetyltransferase involved in cellulose biosynthesis
VSQSETSHGFHLELLRSAAFRVHLSLFLLKLAGRPIAFHYGLTSHGVYSLVMTSYDELFKELSPGHLLTEEVLKDCVSRGLREFDFLGCDLPWKLDWTSTVRPHHWLFIFRDSLFGRTLRQVKFGWVRDADACRSSPSRGRALRAVAALPLCSSPPPGRRLTAAMRGLATPFAADARSAGRRW